MTVHSRPLDPAEAGGALPGPAVLEAAPPAAEPLDVVVPWAWGRLAVATLARGLLIALLGMVAWASLPVLVGWQPTTVVSGSMLPRIEVGDVAVIKPTEPQDLKVGQILLFQDPDHADRLRLHRLVDTTPTGWLVTRGDANEADDSSPVDPATVEGVAVLRVPMLGQPVMWLQQGRWELIGVSALVLVGLLGLTSLDRGLHRALPATAGAERTGGEPLAGGRRRDHRNPGRQEVPTLPLAAVLRGRARVLALTGAALVLALTLILGIVPAWSAFGDQTSGRASWGSDRYYTCTSAPVADGAVVNWRLDETSGTTAADSSGNNFAGTWVNGFTSSTDTRCGPGRSAVLNGSSQYLTPTSTAARTAPQTFSIELWFRTTTDRGGYLAGFGSSRTGNSPQRDRMIYLSNDGTLYFGTYPNGAVRAINSGTATNSPRYRNGQWHHVVGTVSGDGIRLYVNGLLVASDASITGAEPLNGFFRVGQDNLEGWPGRPTSNFFAGNIDNVALYHRALTADEVRAHNALRSP